jgi:hypothetical protein
MNNKHLYQIVDQNLSRFVSAYGSMTDLLRQSTETYIMSEIEKSETLLKKARMYELEAEYHAGRLGL